jgi:hypothetical protein
MKGEMRRLVVLLLLCGLAACTAGCGVGGSSSGTLGAPEPAELVVDAIRAAEAAGSFHYSLEATVATDTSPAVRLTLAGDFAEQQARADVSFEGQGESLAGTLLYADGGFFVKFMDRWYGEQSGFAPVQGLQREFGDENGLTDRFDDFFEGSVTVGPVADGVPTWAFNGRLNVDRILELAEKDGSLEDGTREKVEQLAESTRLTLLVGQADLLPRSFLLDLSGEGADLMGIGGPDGGSFSVTVRGSFSRWGEPVRITPPSSYAPLDELLGQFFSF